MAGELEKASKWDKRYPIGTTAGILKRINRGAFSLHFVLSGGSLKIVGQMHKMICEYLLLREQSCALMQY
jgi:hypothetical protein